MNGSTPHLLIVDDSDLVTGALRILFEETGHRVSVGRGISDAVSTCVADPPDIMLLDLALEDGDGLDVLTRLHALGRAPAMTVAVTGSDDEQTRERCLAAGCRDVLLKPVPTRELLAKVRGWVLELQESEKS